MTATKFESSIFKLVSPFLDLGVNAEFHNGALFVTGAIPDEGRAIRDLLKSAGHRVRMSQSGSYQTDYTFAYDLVAE